MRTGEGSGGGDPTASGALQADGRDVAAREQAGGRTREVLDALLEMAAALVQLGDDDGDEKTEGTLGTVAATRRLVELACTVLGCRRVGITAVDAATGMSRPVAVVGLTPEQERAWRSHQPGAALRDYLDEAQLQRLLADDVLILDASDVAGRTLPYAARTLLLVLMRVGATVVGVLALDHGGAPHTYAADEVALARAVARLAGFVLERERLVRERAEAQASVLALSEANRRMDAFLSLASHELRTPLTTANLNVELAQRRLRRTTTRYDPPEADPTPLLERAYRSLMRLNRLVDDLLDLSRIQGDRLQMNLARVDLTGVVRDVVDEQRAHDPARHIRLHMPNGAPVPVVADAERVGQVALNYLTNALKYAPPGPPIDVGVQVEGSWARVYVRDEGPGLSAQEQERVWDRFYRAEGIEHQTGSSVGLGLGLYISRTIISQHGGEVGLESTPGAGATFWFTLPLADPSA